MARQRVEDDKIIAAYQAKRQAAERPAAKALRGKKMQPAASAESALAPIGTGTLYLMQLVRWIRRISTSS